MGNDNDRGPLLAGHVLKNLQNLLAGLVVQGSGRLVAEQELGLLGQGAGDGDSLLLAP